MSLRGALLAGIIVLTAAGSGTAEFTTPSLDQWGDGVKRIGPRKYLPAGTEPHAAWVASSSTALVSGAPVSIHSLSPDTVTTLAAGEELTLRWAYTRPASPDDVYYHRSVPVAYETTTGMAMPRSAVTPSGAVITSPGVVVTSPGAAVVVNPPGAAVTPSGVVVSTPGVVVDSPTAIVTTRTETVVALPYRLSGTYAREIEMPGQTATEVFVDEGPWVTLSPATVSVIRENTSR